MRYEAAMSKIKSLLNKGAVGQILTISFRERWIVITERIISGAGIASGLTPAGADPEKARHHFDVLNWLVGSRTASGGRSRRAAFLRQARHAARRALPQLPPRRSLRILRRRLHEPRGTAPALPRG